MIDMEVDFARQHTLAWLRMLQDEVLDVELPSPLHNKQRKHNNPTSQSEEEEEFESSDEESSTTEEEESSPGYEKSNKRIGEAVKEMNKIRKRRSELSQLEQDGKFMFTEIDQTDPDFGEYSIEPR
ncbi:uncharacterized protein MELLADRAFT_104177 [Melampsora larici-populina 98AG31]|uniref:Uncharacterized protein n=1 Tax=Melampsora larici-populina (strain 98AG31 / pathotype 3-4-7) TaxID=747676 RepID=F4RDU1_MELLP|nr:uncharacterized protein MELLADRAFT_104177 [Melampsora larici-populina 98AG31]EGG09551.1 hypothetical protein MELLADRAFT_104177 [Melampsora larici-populina 98AG31]